jgi:aromatic ring-opening dioxygenase catalytic subunit (LigB family)
MSETTNILFVSHGGGPLPLLGDPDHREMVTTLKTITESVAKPSAILVISAHWEAQVPTITAGAKPPLIYDYYGFPKESYDIQYPCLGEPRLAQQVHQILNSAGVPANLDHQRGFDHGLFVPLKIMYPDADIPCIQLSLINSLNAEQHIAVGRALQALDWDRLLVLGSGFSFHNMKMFFAPDTTETRAKNQAFEDWLKETIANKQLNETERQRRLAHWEEAPHARFCHPREEHLLPLHVCYGMAGKASDGYLTVDILRKKSAMIRWAR